MTEYSKRIEEITLELTSQLSVVDTSDELLISEKVYSILSELDYFKLNPNQLYELPLKNDNLGRKNVFAIVKGEKKPSSKSVILIGHTDTVGISDFGDLKEYANKPFELMEKLKKTNIPTDVMDDLESNDYIFGRGVFDMKSGVATHMAILEDLSKNTSQWEGSVVFVAVCDEEGSSMGMLNAVGELVRIKKHHEFEYSAVIDTDLMTEDYIGDKNKYIYTGTTGKIMPSFYIIGKETHVGEAFKGLDPTQIASAIELRINMNPEFSDVTDGEVTMPPLTLKMRDLKTEYSCQIAKTAVLFFHFNTNSSTPDELMKKMSKVAYDCFQNTIDTLNGYYKTFCKMIKRKYKVLPWKARVMRYEQLKNVVLKERGYEFQKEIDAYSEKLAKDLTVDARDKGMLLIEFIHSHWSDKNPVIIIYFTPPYYPHICVDEKNSKGKIFLKAIDEVIDSIQTDYKLVRRKFYPGISDLSYASLPKKEKVVDAFRKNTPGFGSDIYNLPIEEIRELNLPIVNIGPFGKDAHKFTERIEKKYTFEITPELVYKTIMKLIS